MPFKVHCWNAYNECPGTASMVVYAALSSQLDTPLPVDDPGPLPVPWTAIPDAVILCLDADGACLGSYAVFE
jgi:hypothetical protein